MLKCSVWICISFFLDIFLRDWRFEVKDWIVVVMLAGVFKGGMFDGILVFIGEVFFWFWIWERYFCICFVLFFCLVEVFMDIFCVYDFSYLFFIFAFMLSFFWVEREVGFLLFVLLVINSWDLVGIIVGDVWWIGLEFSCVFFVFVLLRIFWVCIL